MSIDILKLCLQCLSYGCWWSGGLLILTSCVCTVYCSAWCHSEDHKCDNVALSTTCTLHFTTAGSAKVEVNDQQIQTEIVETEHKSVQVGSMTKQQGVYATVTV